jgi:hypothetical protein
MRVVWIAFIVLGVGFAGCAEDGSKAKSDEILIQSIMPQEISSNATSTTTPKPQAKGHLSGVVVDAAIRPLEGALVKLPGLDRKQSTDRTGAFGFFDLMPGPYFITIELDGFYGAESVVEVHADKIARAKVILERIPPPTPRHQTVQYDGFAQTTATTIGLPTGCTCTFTFYLDKEGLGGVVLESTMSAYGGGPVGTNRFYHSFRDYSPYKVHSSGYTSNPMIVELRDSFPSNPGGRFTLQVEPGSTGLPEINKKFTTYVTSFHNQQPPQGWSVIRGTT